MMHMEKIARKQRYGMGSFGTIELSILDGTVIASFFPEGENMTIKEIMERTEHSYERVNSSLKYLTEKNIVNEKKVGKTLVYSLDLHNLYAEIGFGSYILERESDFIKKHRTVHNAIKEIRDNPYIWMVVLFGSYSKGEDIINSDIDIAVIGRKDKQIDLTIYEKKLEREININIYESFKSIHKNLKENLCHTQNPKLHYLSVVLLPKEKYQRCLVKVFYKH